MEESFEEDNLQALLLARAIPPDSQSELVPSTPPQTPTRQEQQSRQRKGAETKPRCGGSRFCQHPRSCLQNARRGFLKGFWTGYAIKGGINLVTSVLFRALWRRPWQLARHVLGHDAARFGLFWGAFTGGYKGVQCFLRRLRQREDWKNSFAAAGVASLALVLDEPSRRVTWSLWMLARAADLLWRHLGARGVLPMPEHGDLLVFVLASAVVMYAWHMDPPALPVGFHRWISARGGLDDRVTGAVRDVVEGRVPDMVSWCVDNGIAAYRPDSCPRRVPCSVVHPLEPRSCWLHAAKRWFLGFRSGLPVYLVVHCVPLALFSRRRLAAQPLQTLAHSAMSVFYSTAFITSFQTLFWIVFCTTRRLRGADSRASTAVAGLAAGLALLCERKVRRAELALFTVPRALDALWNMLRRRGVVRPVPHANIAIFAVAMSVIMTAYQHDSQLIKPTYLELMRRYFGEN